MAEFTEEMKREAVLAFARYRSPSEVCAMLKDEFGAEVEVRHAMAYDPSRPCYSAGEKWVSIFTDARETYTKDTGAIPSANQSWRINELQDMYRDAKKGGKLSLAASLLEQIAKEVGGVLTNERNINVEKSERGYRGLSPEERRMAVAEIFAAAVDAQAPTAPSTEKLQ